MLFKPTQMNRHDCFIYQALQLSFAKINYTTNSSRKTERPVYKYEYSHTNGAKRITCA